MKKYELFSRHALERIDQRTKLSNSAIAGILDRGLAVNIGHKPGIHKNHLLFYSIDDDDFFVAIQDSLTGGVLTILPLEYQANLAWKVTSEECDNARELVLNALKEIEGKQEIENKPPSKFEIKGHFTDSEGKRKSTKTILKIESLPYQNDVKTLINDDCFFRNLMKLPVPRE